MKGFFKMFRTAFVFCAVMMLLCSFAYPLIDLVTAPMLSAIGM